MVAPRGPAPLPLPRLRALRDPLLVERPPRVVSLHVVLAAQLDLEQARFPPWRDQRRLLDLYVTAGDQQRHQDAQSFWQQRCERMKLDAAAALEWGKVYACWFVNIDQLVTPFPPPFDCQG